ncbi:hypothetical protein O181_051977 [Austropuccinia psidii MF-1]|uniref:Copper acquisition factor BIM1-like domain-containing protein n=1 Tax=Austropuccinia psidii MF-1 TaxID=1389203 RepID=A0A9Q3HQ26_9BASI|nr:hypothetical protein [Austropuccinia psidii MF-1]
MSTPCKSDQATQTTNSDPTGGHKHSWVCSFLAESDEGFVQCQVNDQAGYMTHIIHLAACDGLKALARVTGPTQAEAQEPQGQMDLSNLINKADNLYLKYNSIVLQISHLGSHLCQNGIDSAKSTNSDREEFNRSAKQFLLNRILLNTQYRTASIHPFNPCLVFTALFCRLDPPLMEPASEEADGYGNTPKMLCPDILRHLEIYKWFKSALLGRRRPQRYISSQAVIDSSTYSTHLLGMMLKQAMHYALIVALFTLCGMASVSAHFTLDLPNARGSSMADEPKFCGGFPTDAAGRQAFPLSAEAPIVITSHHASAEVAIIVSFNSNPTSFSDFDYKGKTNFLMPFGEISGAGSFCFKVDISPFASHIPNITDGTLATLQVEYKAGNDTLYQCSDLILQKSFTPPESVACANHTSTAS